MSKPNDGGPVYPTVKSANMAGMTQTYEIQNGMTLRDYFAAAALQGLMANGRIADNYMNPTNIANTAHDLADAMLAERNKEGK